MYELSSSTLSYLEFNKVLHSPVSEAGNHEKFHKRDAEFIQKHKNASCMFPFFRRIYSKALECIMHVPFLPPR